jgi:glutamate decarboxylase
VSPALTLIEKSTVHHLASVFHLTTNNPHAGGVSQPGGSASNMLALLTARNTLFPATKTSGIASIPHNLTILTSAHAHYSTAKAASLLGFGHAHVRSVPVDPHGRMTGPALQTALDTAHAAGETPFFVCATAGTTVLGSFDDLVGIAAVCAAEHRAGRGRLWLHVDGSWGAPVIFSGRAAARDQLGGPAGVGRADSVAVTPHKMLGVSLTCSFLLVRDVRALHAANRVQAGYLFHSDEDGGNVVDETPHDRDGGPGHDEPQLLAAAPSHIWDLADLTPQCGRKGDALKFFLSWTYHGAAGYAQLVDAGLDTAAHLAALVHAHPAMVLVSERPPPCMQVCWYYAPDGMVPDGSGEEQRRMTRVTEGVCRALVRRGFMVDWAPGDKGSFLRAVVNGETRRGTVEGLVKAVSEEGKRVWGEVGAPRT